MRCLSTFASADAKAWRTVSFEQGVLGTPEILLVRRMCFPDFARRALEREGVIVLPGSALGTGGEGYFRVALTVAEDRLAEAAVRLGRLI